jgi:hypothetical protein
MQIFKFERLMHKELNMRDFTKGVRAHANLVVTINSHKGTNDYMALPPNKPKWQELKSLISSEGVEAPGETYWDPDDCVMKTRDCRKAVRAPRSRPPRPSSAASVWRMLLRTLLEVLLR